MKSAQMELSFGNGHPCDSSVCRPRRLTRARWWFERMRAVVDQAISPAPMHRAEQTFFPNAHRRPLMPAERRNRNTEQQIAA